jgi:phenylacetate-CoA ligase
MSYTLKRSLYDTVPLGIKKVTSLIPFSIWAGRLYRETYRRGVLFERESREEIKKYQERELGRVLQYAVQQVPAYEKQRNIVQRMRPFEAIKDFPFLEKDKLQQDLRSFLPRNFDKIPHYEITTGGTSGKQLKLYVDDNSQSVETAFVHRIWQRVGYTTRHRKATFRGVTFRHLKPGIFWQENPIYNEMQFSPFHMSENTLGAYVEAIVRYAPSYFHGYPSAMDLLADYIISRNLKKHVAGARAVFLVSEGFNAVQRSRIEDAFSCRVLSFYGHSEAVVKAGECECSDAYHQFPDYGFLEIVAEDGSICWREGQRGEIVGTGFLNRCLPLIRYRTGDYGTLLQPKCQCGRNWDRFTNVDGRWKQDMIVGKNGARISLTALNMHSKIFNRVLRYQYFQEKAGICELRIMKSENFHKADAVAIEEAFRMKVSDELIVKVRIVDEIPLTARGKVKLFESKVTNETPEHEPLGQNKQ